MHKIGERVGKLTLLKRKRENNRTYFYCKCDCGNEKWIRADCLGPVISCGCYNKEENLYKANDLTNMKFGRLTAIKPKDKSKDGVMWECKCNCGNITYVLSSNLKSGKITSCGCTQKEARKENIQKAIKGNIAANIVDHTNIKHISREKPIKSNTSGVTGVKWDKSRQKWYAEIEFKSKRHYLGRYKNKEDAIKARKEAEEKYFKNFLDKLKQKEDR